MGWIWSYRLCFVGLDQVTMTTHNQNNFSKQGGRPLSLGKRSLLSLTYFYGKDTLTPLAASTLTFGLSAILPALPFLVLPSRSLLLPKLQLVEWRGTVVRRDVLLGSAQKGLLVDWQLSRARPLRSAG